MNSRALLIIVVLSVLVWLAGRSRLGWLAPERLGLPVFPAWLGSVGEQVPVAQGSKFAIA